MQHPNAVTPARLLSRRVFRARPRARASSSNGSITNMTKKAKAGEPAASDKTEAKQSGLIPFAPGQSGNPTGRPKGSRNKLGEAFIEALHGDFNEHGVVAIQVMRGTDPGGYVRVIASLLPKEFKIETTSDLTDEQLDARIRQLASALEIGVGGSADGASAEAQPQPPQGVPAVH